VLLLKVGFHNHLISLGKSPHFAVLEVDVLEILLADVQELELLEVEGILEGDVVLLKAKHAVHVISSALVGKESLGVIES